MTSELKPINRKSFYGKAKMIREQNKTKLLSYNTIVAVHDHQTNEMDIKGYYSATTMRHINAFRNYFNFATMKKSK